MKISEFRKINGSYTLKLLHLVSFRKIKRQLYSQRYSNITHSARRINRIMKGKAFNYLEVGVAYGLTFEGVQAIYKDGVDPNPKFNLRFLPDNCNIYKLSSDEFFSKIGTDSKYNFIFLDGLHEINQLIRDLVHSLKIIERESWILIDDVVPYDSISAINNLASSKILRKTSESPDFIGWHGDCFKIIELIINKFTFLDYYLIIYPDNPQLLLRFKKGFDANNIEFENFSSYYEFVSNITFETTFASRKLRSLPIYIEELLINALLVENLINE